MKKKQVPFQKELRSLTDKVWQYKEKQRKAAEKARQLEHQQNLATALKKNSAFIADFLRNAQAAAESGESSFKVQVFAGDAVNPLNDLYFVEAFVQKLRKLGLYVSFKNYREVPIEANGQRYEECSDFMGYYVPGNLDLLLEVIW